MVVLTGAAGNFCSGADLSEVGTVQMHQLQWMRQVGAACLALHEIPQPVIAKVEGVAVGAGANLALGCDLIVAAEDARFSEIFARRGLNIDFGGSFVLPRLIGLHKAKELAFFADIVSAKEAQEFGIVNRVVRSWSGIELRDFGCMLRGYHRSVVEPMLRRPELRGQPVE